MTQGQDDARTALQEIVEQIIGLQLEAPLPMPLSAWLAWLEPRVDHPMKMVSVGKLEYPWQPWMIQQDQPLLWSASWYARKKIPEIIRKVRASEHFDNDIDYITYTVEYSVTRATQTLGTGNQSVYVYGFLNDPGFLKIGRAGNASDKYGAFQRVMQQISTSNRLLPTLHHVIFTHDCICLERHLHRRLKDMGRWVYDGAGTEWFRVSIDEVLTIYRELEADI